VARSDVEVAHHHENQVDALTRRIRRCGAAGEVDDLNVVSLPHQIFGVVFESHRKDRREHERRIDDHDAGVQPVGHARGPPARHSAMKSESVARTRRGEIVSIPQLKARTAVVAGPIMVAVESRTPTMEMTFSSSRSTGKPGGIAPLTVLPRGTMASPRLAMSSLRSPAMALRSNSPTGIRLRIDAAFAASTSELMRGNFPLVTVREARFSTAGTTPLNASEKRPLSSR